MPAGRAPANRVPRFAATTAVVKVGTSSITSEQGELDDESVMRLCDGVADARARGHEIVLVCSGAIASGLPALGLTTRPTDIGTLQAVAAVGQPLLMERFGRILGDRGLLAGQVLLTPHDFGVRSQYLHARETLRRLLDLGVVPIVNENDTVADDEIRYGDNDRLAALVSHLVSADVLVLLTDTLGLFTADPRLDEHASLIEEIAEVDAALESVAGGAGSARGSGGMASKLAAAKIAAWSGVRAVIAAADAPSVIVDAVEGRAVGTAIRPRAERLSSRKLWIAFARPASGRIVVDAGARNALCTANRSLLAAGVRGVEGSFEPDDAVEIVDDTGAPFAKGLVRYSAAGLRDVAGRRTSELAEGLSHEVVHRDDLVVLP
jgi:glutamate 5-kinase